MSENNENDGKNVARLSDGNDEVDSSEYPPHVVSLEPDIGLGTRTQPSNRKRRGSGGNSRCDESNISFRHFLQNGHSSSYTYPDIYSCSRQERCVVDGSVVDPASPDLPDFVQDHLAVEHMYFNENSNNQIVSVQNLPDFAMFRNETDEMRLRQRSANALQNPDNRRVLQNRVSLDLPAPSFLKENEPQASINATLPFDLTTQGGAVPNACNSRSPTDIEVGATGGHLPDFLYDGHVFAPGNPRQRDSRNLVSENGNGTEANNERNDLVTMLRRENNKLYEELSVLQSVLLKKDDRIKELEDLVMALEISKLQISADANTQTSSKATDDHESNCSKKENPLSKDEVNKFKKEDTSKPTETCIKNSSGKILQQPAKENIMEKVREMTSTSEKLVRELSRVIGEMQDVFLNDTTNSSVRRQLNNNLDDTAGASTYTV